MKPLLALLLLLCALPSAQAASPQLDAALVKAVDRGNPAQIRRLVMQGADVNARNDIGQTVLERPAEYGAYDSVKVLLDLGANVNSTSNYGGPLVSASQNVYGNSPVAVCRLLLDRGANPNGHSGEETPLLAALGEAVGAKANRVYMGSLVVSTTDHSPTGQRRAEETVKAETERLRQAFVKGEQDRISKVHTAGLQIVRLLISKGADVNLTLKDGTSPLMAAARAGSVDALRLLVDSGARADKTSLNAALEPAALSGSTPAVQFLLLRGANPNAGRARCNPAITTAALADATESIKLLANAGADVNAQGVNGNTALNLVILGHDVPAVKFLLAHGANPNIPDKDGRTSLYWAKEMKNVELTTLLESAGAKK